MDDRRLLTMGLVGLGIAHELNSPLTTTALALELLGERLRGPAPPAPEAVADELDRVLAGVRRMGELVRRLRALAKGRGGAPEPLALDEVLDAAVELARPTFAELGEVRVARGEACPDAHVHADRVLLEQATLCLLLNALDALRADGGEVVATAYLDAGVPTLQVRDDGPGFGDADAAVAAGHSSKGEAGMGVGLALARLIAHEAGAQLVTDNAPGGGARVRIRFEEAEPEGRGPTGPNR